MEQHPPLPAHEVGSPQPGQVCRFQHPRRLCHYLLLWLVPAAAVGDGSLGWTRQTVYARDLRTGYIRRVEVLRPAHAGDPHAPPDDDHEPPPGAAARQQAGPSTSVDPPLRETA
jgi:hypothetical protein